ncbi:MAG: 3-phosphoserine/phosphohydroxythreonine transaminase [Bacteroidota bacterium]
MVYNFSAGPAVLPPAVLEQAQREFRDYRGTGMSVMEMSHRGAVFTDIITRAEASLRKLMDIPEEYAVLFLQGGASTQFAMIPLNLMHKGHADFINTGIWSERAIAEASRYGTAREAASSADRQYTYVPAWHIDSLHPNADYLHITTNNTIYGTRMPYVPKTGDVALVADMSSDILSGPINVSDYDLIYAGAQKNIGPSGITIVIVRRDLIGKARPETPVMLDYAIHEKKKSVYNTPPTYAIYMAGLVFDWVIAEGGVSAMAARNQAKATHLYNYLDQSAFYQPNVDREARSLMNITYRLTNESLQDQFLQEAEAAGLHFLKGHRSVGGLRASLYNAMPLEGVEALVKFMDAFAKAN